MYSPRFIWFYFYKAGSVHIFWKGLDSQEPNILHCVGHIVSVTKLSCCSVEAVMHYANKWVCLCANKTLFAKTDGGPEKPKTTMKPLIQYFIEGPHIN